MVCPSFFFPLENPSRGDKLELASPFKRHSMVCSYVTVKVLFLSPPLPSPSGIKVW